MARLSLACCLIISACAVASAADEADAILGVWQTPDKDARFEFTKTLAGTYEGRMVWLQEPNFPPGDPEAGKPKRDRENPDPAKRNQPFVGLRLLDNLKYAGSGVWKGNVYDPEHGKTYSCKVTIKDPSVLELRGYVGISLLGRTEKWTRYVPEK